MSRRRLKNEKKASGGAPSWTVTFSDLMSLLLTFFILLYSMSSIDAVKFKNISMSLQGILSGMGQSSVIDTQGGTIADIGDDMMDFEHSQNLLDVNEGILLMHEKVSEYVSEEGLEAEVSVSMNKRGVFVDIKEAILFDSGSALIKDSGIEVLKKLEGLINDFNNDLVIEGHTDNVPSNTMMYPSNWELSTARAVSVLRYLSEVEDVDPKRLSAIGYGEYSPIAPNDTRENRAINRRVNILIIFDEESDEING